MNLFCTATQVHRVAAQVFSLYEGKSEPGGAPTPRTVEAAGVTLDELRRMASSIPRLRPARCFYAEEMGGGVDELREVIRRALRSKGSSTLRIFLNHSVLTLLHMTYRVILVVWDDLDVRCSTILFRQ